MIFLKSPLILKMYIARQEAQRPNANSFFHPQPPNYKTTLYASHTIWAVVSWFVSITIYTK